MLLDINGIWHIFFPVPLKSNEALCIEKGNDKGCNFKNLKPENMPLMNSWPTGDRSLVVLRESAQPEQSTANLWQGIQGNSVKC